MFGVYCFAAIDYLGHKRIYYKTLLKFSQLTMTRDETAKGDILNTLADH